MKLFSRRSSDSSSSSPPRGRSNVASSSNTNTTTTSNANASSSSSTSSGTNNRSNIEKARSKSPSPRRPITQMRRLSLAPNITSSSYSSSTSLTNPPSSSRRRLSRINFLSRFSSNDPNYNNDNSFSNVMQQQISHNSTSSTSSSPSKLKLNFTEKYKLIVLGGSKVGKTSIVQRFLYNKFPEIHAATVEELHHAEYNVKGLGSVSVDILDTSGSFEFPAMRRLAISGGHAFVLVYSIDDKESFDEISRLRELIIQVKNSSTTSSSNTSTSGSSSQLTGCTNRLTNSVGLSDITEGETSNDVPPIVIVANKSDLKENRQVSKELAECECIDWDVAFVEASAKEDENIVNIFQQLLLQAHLKGVLKGISAAVNAGNTLNIEPKRERRRSSLPVNELFHHHLSKLSHRSPTSPDPKRNSCALS